MLRRFRFRRSLRGSLFLLLLMICAASATAAYLMAELFRTSVAAQIDRAEAIATRGCASIADRYRFYATNWQGPLDLKSEPLRRDLIALVILSLRDLNGVEGGIWQVDAGPLAYAFPTYEGGGTKTDIPAAEWRRIQAANAQAVRNEGFARAAYSGRSQTLLVQACPLNGPIPNLSAWTMTRVVTAAFEGYDQLKTGLIVLFACVASAVILLARLLITWSTHVKAIERGLSTESRDLPPVPLTGELELDRIIGALNRAGERLAETRSDAEAMARKVAAAERLSAIGRMTAAFAHEIRNPIAAMRLRAENALASNPSQSSPVLHAIIEQIDRLDRLVRQLLTASRKEEPRFEKVAMARFLDSITQSYRPEAATNGIRLANATDISAATLDPGLTARAIGNLLSNALAHCEADDGVTLSAHRTIDGLVIDVKDDGPGVSPEVRDRVFEPFGTGKPDGTGLGLAIAAEGIASQGGTLRLLKSDRGAHFQIILPER